MKRLLLLAAALVAAPAVAAPAEPITAVAASQSARQAAGALAQIVAPREVMISLNMKWAEKGIEELPKLNGEMREFEREFPGVHNAMWLAVKDELHAQLEADLPDLWSSLEQLYLADMTEKEIGALIGFYTTPTGKRLIQGMYGNSDLQPMIQSLATSEDGTISEQSFRAVTEDAKRKAVADANIDPKDILPLIAAMPLPKLRAVGEKTQLATMQWVNVGDPQQQARIDKLMADAAERFVKSREAPSK